MEKRSYIFSRDYSIDPRNRPAPAQTRENVSRLLDDCEEESVGSIESLTSICSKDEDSASVYLRVRPSKHYAKFLVENNTFTIFNADLTVEKQFKFTDVLNCNINQREVYNTCVNNSINNDDNLTLLMYGTSGSGKTFTLIGDADQPGIIPRAIEHIFTRYGSCICKTPKIKPEAGNYRFLSDEEIEIEAARRLHYIKSQNGSIFSGDKEKIQGEHDFIELNATKTAVFVWISFFEIYNENVIDLLNHDTMNLSKKRDGLNVMSNFGRTFVKDLTSVFTCSSEEATELLTMGLNQRLNASTNINNKSSRSHCLFLIDVIKQEEGNLFHNKYKFCDLAGSERVKKSETTGSRLRETQNINTSLLVLGRCLEVTFSNQKKKKPDLVPFRESKLTTFLQSALNGTEKLTMVVNIWPVVQFHDENKHVLNYAAMAKNIVHKKGDKAERNSLSSRRYSRLFDSQSQLNVNNTLVLDENYRLKEDNFELVEENNYLYDELDKLRCENEELRRKNESIESKIRREMADTLMRELKRKEKAVESRLQMRIDFLQKTHAEVVAELKEKIERKNMELDSLYEELNAMDSSSTNDTTQIENCEENSQEDSDVIAID